VRANALFLLARAGVIHPSLQSFSRVVPRTAAGAVRSAPRAALPCTLLPGVEILFANLNHRSPPRDPAVAFLFTQLLVNLPGRMPFTSVDREGCHASREVQRSVDHRNDTAVRRLARYTWFWSVWRVRQYFRHPIPRVQSCASARRRSRPRSERPTLLFGRKAITLDERGDHSDRLEFPS